MSLALSSGAAGTAVASKPLASEKDSSIGFKRRRNEESADDIAKRMRSEDSSTLSGKNEAEAEPTLRTTSSSSSSSSSADLHDGMTRDTSITTTATPPGENLLDILATAAQRDIEDFYAQDNASSSASTSSGTSGSSFAASVPTHTSPSQMELEVRAAQAAAVAEQAARAAREDSTISASDRPVPELRATAQSASGSFAASSAAAALLATR